jgi:hypothetical protein
MFQFRKNVFLGHVLGDLSQKSSGHPDASIKATDSLPQVGLPPQQGAKKIRLPCAVAPLMLILYL